ncbi:hypothetical protein EH222_13960, partial [candidate division KSB1 bacterium]
MKTLLLLLLPLCHSCARSSHEMTLFLTSFRLSLSSSGSVTEWLDLQTGVDYLARTAPAALLSVLMAGELKEPLAARYEKNSNMLFLTYSNDIEACVQVTCKDKYVTFELMSITKLDTIELVLWGPYPTSMNRVIGETVGVVQGESFALGIQALNPKTLGGYPWNENDCMPQIDIFDQDDLSDLSEQGKRSVLY